MKWVEFVERCNRTIEDKCKNFDYLSLGAISEAGEVAGKYKKWLRGDYGSWIAFRSMVKYEIGDVLWYIAMLDFYCHYEGNEKVDPRNLSTRLNGHRENPVKDIVALNKFLTRVADESFGCVTPVHIDGALTLVDNVANAFGFTLAECSEAVISKLAERKEAGTIRGDGDGVIR